MSDRFRTLAAASACAGIVAVLVGVFLLANLASFIGGSKINATMTGRGVLIAAELFECAAFSLAALAAVALNGGRHIAWGAAVLKPIILVGLLAVHWGQFWYFMLDLRGPDALALLVVILSGIQALLLFLAALSLNRRT